MLTSARLLRMTREIVRLYVCRLHGHLSSLVWQVSLLFPKSELDLAVDIRNCVIDVTLMISGTFVRSNFAAMS